MENLIDNSPPVEFKECKSDTKMPEHYETIDFFIQINSHNTYPSLIAIVKKSRRQVNKKFCELKGGNIGIVEKAQETRFGMSPKYSRHIGIAS